MHNYARSLAYAYFLKTVLGKSEEQKGRRDESMRDAILEAWYPTPFAVSGGEGDAAITNQLHDQPDNAPVRLQSQ